MLSGCQISAGTSLESSPLTPTGYATKEVQRISVFYDGSLYLHNATGFDLPKEDSWELLGQVASVNNLEWPSKDFAGTHLYIGQEIYREPSEPQKLYVKYDSGFALFEAEETFTQCIMFKSDFHSPLHGDEIMKNEQIQPIRGNGKVTGTVDTDIVSASNSASDTLISIADSVTEIEITHIVSGTESQWTVNSDDELEALKN